MHQWSRWQGRQRADVKGSSHIQHASGLKSRRASNINKRGEKGRVGVSQSHGMASLPVKMRTRETTRVIGTQGRVDNINLSCKLERSCLSSLAERIPRWGAFVARMSHAPRTRNVFPVGSWLVLHFIGRVSKWYSLHRTCWNTIPFSPIICGRARKPISHGKCAPYPILNSVNSESKQRKQGIYHARLLCGCLVSLYVCDS